MRIRIGLLVFNIQNSERYKRIIDYNLRQEFIVPEFVVYPTKEKLYDQIILNRESVDILILQASPANFTLGNMIRQQDRSCIIIYPAQNLNYVLQAFESMPIAYIDSSNPGASEKMIIAIKKAVYYTQLMRTALHFETKSKVMQYSLSDIDYFESQYRIVHIVEKNGNIESINGKLNDIESDFNLPGFCRCHQSYLVNMAHITSVDKSGKQIYLQSGKTVPASKNLFPRFLEALGQFTSEEVPFNG